MALEDMWGLTPKNEDEKVTCPACGGCRKEPSSLDYSCGYCDGSGKVSKKTRQWLEEMGY